MKLNLPKNVGFEEGLKAFAGTYNISVDELLARMGLPKPDQGNGGSSLKDLTLNEGIEIYKNSPKYQELAASGKPSYDIGIDQLKEYLQNTIYKDVPEEHQRISLIKPYMLEDFLATFKTGKKKGSKFSPRTRNKKLAAIRSLFNTLQNKELIIQNPAKKVNYEKPSKLKADYLTPEQQQKALDISRTGYFGTRNFTMVYFLLNSGAREEGLENLNWPDVDFKEGTLTLDEKGGKKRTIPMVRGLAEQFMYYRTVYKDIFDKNPNGPVFVNLKGSSRGTRITEGSIRSVMERIYAVLGFNDCCLHRTRRTFALNCLEAGMSLPEIRDLLGHENCGTTEEYLRLSDVHLREVMRKHFPFAVVSYEKAKEFGWDR